MIDSIQIQVRFVVIVAKLQKHILIYLKNYCLITIATDSNLCLTCYHDNESKKTNSLQPNINAIYVTTTPKSSRKILVLRKSTIDYIMSILVLEYESILHVIEGVTTTTTATNDKDIEYKMGLGWLTKIILI